MIPAYDDPLEVEDEDDSLWRQSVWVVTRQQLLNLANTDLALKDIKLPNPIPIVARMFVTYTRMVQKLDKCWKETYQFQKNQAIRRFLDATVKRLTEIKDALIELDMSEFHYVDGELIELKLVPQDLEIIHLSAYPIKRDAQLQELRERLYKGERIYIDPEELELLGQEEEEVEERKIPKRPIVEKKLDPVWEAIKDAIRLIQNHERARCGRLEFFDEKNLFDLRNTFPPPTPVPKDIGNQCATHIQRLWKGYCVRRDLKEREKKSDELLGLTVPFWRSTELQDKLKEYDEIKRIRREEKAKEYIETCLNEKERILKVVGPGLMEDIGDEIRWWFRNWYDVAKAFDKYPDEEDGGTIMVVRGETLTPEEYREEQERKRREKEKLKNNPALAKKMKEEAARKKKEAKEKAKKERERIKKEKREAKLRAKKGIVEPFSFKESPALNYMAEANEKFDLEWTPEDDVEAVNDKLIMDKITIQKCYEVQLEMRVIVDEMMRLELELLEAAHERDRTAGKKGKKKKKPKKKKKKKGKKGKKGKKDITGHRTIEDLFQELYDNGVIRKYPKIELDSYIGDYGYKNLELRYLYYSPLPSVGEIKQTVLNNCIIPLGGDNMPRPKSVCICGPRQSGKKHLVYAVCNATDAVLFDLSPQVTAGKYGGKESMKIFLHLINKMSRILQPSVIMVEGADKMFYKKVPKPERSLEPKKLKGKLFKQVIKPITAEDKVMVIGTSSQPWICTQKPFLKAYEKFIMIPRTDYGTVYQLWMDILMNYGQVNRKLDVSALAKLSVGYPVPYIKEVAEKVICPRRLIRLKFEPLRQHELLECLMTNGQPEPVTQQEQDKFTTWYNKKTKIGKMRTKVIGTLLEKRLAEEAMEAKKKEKQKK